MRKQNRIYAAAAAAALILSLAGCGNSDETNKDSAPAETSAAALTTVTTTAASETTTETTTTTAAQTETTAPAETAPESAWETGEYAPVTADEIAAMGYDETDNTWSVDGDEYDKFVKIMKNEIAKSEDIKGTYLLATDDRIIFIGGINSTEADGSTKVNAYSTYEIGSVTKTFTATAVLQLIEQGKLSLDDKLGTYIPEYEKGADVTINQLLHMQSGIQREFFTNEEQHDMELFKKYYNDGFTDGELIAALNNNELEFEPGSKTAYSNVNYTLLAMVIEKVTGESYCDYVQKNIFDICGMEHTSSMKLGDLTTVPEPPFEGQYVFDIYEIMPDGYLSCPRSGRGAGDIHSCAADLLAFDRALVNGKLLNADSLAKMFDLSSGYGCGWQMFRYGTRDVYVHEGATPLYATYNMYFRSKKYGNIYLIQLHPTFADMEQARTCAEDILLASKT